MSRESVWIALLHVAMKNLNVTCGDVKSTFLSATTSEMLYNLLGSKFGADTGKYALIVRALYEKKSWKRLLDVPLRVHPQSRLYKLRL